MNAARIVSFAVAFLVIAGMLTVLIRGRRPTPASSTSAAVRRPSSTGAPRELVQQLARDARDVETARRAASGVTTEVVPVADLAGGMLVERVPIIGRLSTDFAGITPAHGETASGHLVAVIGERRGGTPMMLRFDGGTRVYVSSNAQAIVRDQTPAEDRS